MSIRRDHVTRDVQKEEYSINTIGSVTPGAANAMNSVRIQHRNSNVSKGDGSVGSATCTLLAGLESIMKLEVDQIVSYFDLK